MSKLNIWGSVRFDPWWHHEHKSLLYINEPFNDLHTESEWRARGFRQEIFTGDLYDMRSPAPDWVLDFQSLLRLRYFSWSVYRMSPGRILPSHSDTYQRFRQINHITDIDSVVRYVIFLEDWKSGHYFEIAKTPVVKWKAGEGVYWYGATEHLAANLGESDRYTLQLTGLPLATSS